MSKAMPNDVSDLGFAAAQFNLPADWDAYIQAVLDDAALEVEHAVGAAVYASATTGLTFKRLKTAEVYFAAAELWRRREAFERADAVRARQSSGGGETIGSRLLANADAMERQAWEQVAMVTGTSRDGALAVGVVESGAFASLQA